MTSAIQPPRLRSFSSLGGTRHQAPHSNLCSPLIISRATHSTRRLGQRYARSPARRCRCEAESRRGPGRDDGRGLATGEQSSEKGEREDDLSYKRQDMSVQHTHESRQRFARCIQRGEAGVNLAEAALQIAAEDDAIVSHSAVAFPVDAYLGRIQRMVDELARLRLEHLNPDTATPEEFLGVVDKYLYEEQRLGIGGPGKSAIPASAKVAHPGVWEEPRRAYLNELLTRRVGTPAALAILYAEVMQGLLQKGAVNFAVRMECPSFNELPRAVVLQGLTRASLSRPDGTLMNTCTMDALYEVLVHLKRSYWPFGWDSSYTQGGESFASYGGFDAAARAAVEGMQSAEMEAISRTAAHRLSRGIWTSPGAGDLRRAKAAAERICMLVGDDRPSERRDAAVLLIHSGEFAQGRAELKAYLASAESREAPSETRILVDRLMDKVDDMLGPRTASSSPKPVISVSSVLRKGRPEEKTADLLDLPW